MRQDPPGRTPAGRTPTVRLSDFEQILQYLWASTSTSEKWDISPTSQDYYDDRLNKQTSLK